MTTLGARTWSGWGTAGYAVGQAISESGKLEGPWKQLEKPFWPENGGHGMVFRDSEGKLRYTLHFPNDIGKEHPIIRHIGIGKDKRMFIE